ncbi:MAG: DUF1016 family protein [Bacteroidales bacterium]|nr:DUF1016 family protein [Bacteroidales bacterium]
MDDTKLPLLIKDFTDNYVADIRHILELSRRQVYRNINVVMVQTYWMIGYRIVMQEQKGKERAEYGSRLIEKLSRELSDSFSGGISEAQLWNFRQFYNTFPDVEILNTLCRELSWSHIRLIMRLPNEDERLYYINETKLGNWSVRELQRNIKTDAFHRLIASQHSETSKPAISAIQTYIKDPYILDFLGINPHIKVKERSLENAIISHMQQFLLEMGRGFSFVERQMHIATEMSDFYIDLVFYNYLLKCFVLIDLKTTRLTHRDIGQMDMYVRMFDQLKRQSDDNPTIGLILCAEKDEIVAKYSLLSESTQIYASKYFTVLPSEDELSAELTRNRLYLATNSTLQDHQLP